jgi:hypothetical protein
LQQQVLLALIAGRLASPHGGDLFSLGYHTVRRWWRWLQTAHAAFSFHLRSRFAWLGRSAVLISRVCGWPVSSGCACARRWHGSTTTALLSRDRLTPVRCATALSAL